MLRVQSRVTCVRLTLLLPFHVDCGFQGVGLCQAAGDHRHHRRQPSSKNPRARDTQPITDGSAQTNQFQMEVSGGPLELEHHEFTEINVLKEATRSCPTQDQCAGGLCARGLRKPNVKSWPPSFPGPLLAGRVATPATAAGEHQNRSWRFTFDTLVEIASQDSAELHPRLVHSLLM